MGSITTKRGDDGTTDLLYGIRVGKDHPRVAVLGAVDELSAALGMARAGGIDAAAAALLREVQLDLIGLMGELATAPQDAGRYAKDGFQSLAAEKTDRLTQAAASLEKVLSPPKGWCLPGDGGKPGAAALEFARAVCRKAEREILSLPVEWKLPNLEAIRFLNRLSDLLWLQARAEEKGE